jgi:hypothetical protein
MEDIQFMCQKAQARRVDRHLNAQPIETTAFISDQGLAGNFRRTSLRPAATRRNRGSRSIALEEGTYTGVSRNATPIGSRPGRDFYAAKTLSPCRHGELYG